MMTSRSRLQRVLPPVLFLISINVMVVLHFAVPGPRVMPFPANLVGLAMLVFGLVMTTAAARSFNRAGTNIKTFDEPDVLVTDGWFRYTRNPMYLGFATALLGLAGVLGSTSPLFAVAAFGIVTDRWYIQFEERAMQRQFGPAYDAYRARTRRWI